LIVDFHSHTYKSDGTLSPQALADFMGERKVEVFSISDHDTIAAYGDFTPPPGARVVTGVEINTAWRDNEVHVLGYRIRLDDPDFNALLAQNRASRRVRMEKMIEQLRAAGYSITMDDVEREAENGEALGRPHVGKALVRSGEFETIDAAFRALLYRGRAGYVPSSHISPEGAIAAIHAAGGIAILAHPGRMKDQALVEEAIALGIDGLEAFYPRHDAEETAHFRQLAADNGLLVTAGADFHDIRYHAHGVGMTVDERDIAPFLEATLG
jgi:predicted metal-dependent phosphoesterase TrpH